MTDRDYAIKSMKEITFQMASHAQDYLEVTIERHYTDIKELMTSYQKLILENQVVLEELDMECQEKINEDMAYALSYLSIYNNQLNVPKMHREMNNLMIIYGLSDMIYRGMTLVKFYAPNGVMLSEILHIVKRVNEARKSNGNNVRDFNFFKQKIVCADCGKTMYLYGKTKGSHRRFYCGNNKLHGKCTPHSITDLEVNDYVLRVIRAHINVYVENVDLIRRLNQRQESIKKYDVFNREIKKCRKELEKVAVHRERLFEDYVCRIIDAEQYETFSKQDAETEKEIQNNMEILLKHQVGYEKNFHTEEEWETLINKYRNTRTLTKEMVNAFVEKIEIHESGSITVRLVYDDMLEELRKYAKEREAELCQ